jgi:hypothetical protein
VFGALPHTKEEEGGGKKRCAWTLWLVRQSIQYEHAFASSKGLCEKKERKRRKQNVQKKIEKTVNKKEKEEEKKPFFTERSQPSR